MLNAPNVFRLREGPLSTTDEDGNHGVFMVPLHIAENAIACSVDETAEWEHVVVRYTTRCPTWEEMCAFKKIFWEPEDCVVQYHPPQSDYVNTHPFCLHLWRFKGEMPRPFLNPTSARRA